jgi:predicted RNA-binding protein with PIN domain
MSRRLLIDVMNVVGSRPDKWWNDPDRAVRRMVEVLDDHAGATRDALTLVLDKDPGALPDLEHVDLVVARRKGRNAADYEIERIVEGAEDPSAFTVVTSDKRLADKVRSLGAGVVGAGAFRKKVEAEG